MVYSSRTDNTFQLDMFDTDFRSIVLFWMKTFPVDMQFSVMSSNICTLLDMELGWRIYLDSNFRLYMQSDLQYLCMDFLVSRYTSDLYRGNSIPGGILFYYSRLLLDRGHSSNSVGTTVLRPRPVH